MIVLRKFCWGFVVEIIFALFSVILGLVLLFSGVAALIWLFRLQARFNELTTQNARLETTLRRLQHDLHTTKSSSTPTGIITVEATESAAPPARPAPPPPVAPFVVSPPAGMAGTTGTKRTIGTTVTTDAAGTADATEAAKSSAATAVHDLGTRFRSGIDPAERTAAQWAKGMPWMQKAGPQIQPSSAGASPAPIVPAKKSADDSAKTLQSWEMWIGKNLIGWIAVGCFILAAALFISYAVTMGWVTNSLKVAGIAAFGAGLLGLGYYSRRTGLQRFSNMMSCAGIILIYMAGYASYAIYKLVDFSTASMLMPIIVLGGFLLAWLYRSKLLGTVAILGGLAVPILVSSPEDHHVEFFVYLMSLNIGTLILVNLLRRAPIAWIAFFGTQYLFWGWFVGNYESNKIAPVLFFHAAFYLAYLSDTIIAARKPIGKKLIPTWDDAMRAVLAPIIFFGAIYFISKGIAIRVVESSVALAATDAVHVTLYNNLGIFAFIMAAWYALLTVCYTRHLARLWNADIEKSLSQYWQAAPSAATVIALGFVAIGIPLQFDAMWITLGWLTVFGGLWYFGHRQVNKTFVVMSIVFFGLGMFRFMVEMVDQLRGVRELLEMTPVFNTIALPLLAGAGVLVVAAVMANRFIKTADSRRQTAADASGAVGAKNVLPLPSAAVSGLPSAVYFNHFFGIFGYFLLGVVLSGEATRFFYINTEIWSPYHPNYLHLAFLLGFWFLLPVLLLQVGFVFRSKVNTATAYCGLALATTFMILGGFHNRCLYNESFNNPFSIVLIGGSLILLAIGYQSKFVPRRYGEPHFQNIFGGFGVVGLFTLLAILTIEWLYFFTPWANGTTTFRSLTLFWSLYALFWIVLGFAVRNLPIRVCGMIVLFGTLAKTMFVDANATFGYCSWVWGAGYSLEHWTPLANPYFLTMLCPVIPALVIAIWVHGTLRIAAKDREGTTDMPDHFMFVGAAEKIAWKVAGILGLSALLLYLSIECHQFFNAVEPRLFALEQKFLASTSLTIFWTIAAIVLTTLALQFQSRVLRITSMALLVLTALKVFADLDVRPEFTMPFLNPYFLPMFLFAGVLIALGYMWMSRLSEESRAEKGERDVYRVLALGGVVFLWLTMSMECFRSFGVIEAKYISPMQHKFLASASLTIFWTLLAVILTVVAWRARSAALRMISMSLLGLTALKIFLDLEVRPVMETPFFNLYFMPMFIFAMVLIALSYLWASRLNDASMERKIYRVIAFSGVVFLWLTLTMECYRSVRLLRGAGPEAWQAQMALSILWSLFAGILIAVGFIWRSATLRWMAILLFAATLTKVLIVDMSGVNELYRFGAVFVLALLLMSAAWAYQRFKPG